MTDTVFTEISNLLQPAEAEGVLGHGSMYKVSLGEILKKGGVRYHCGGWPEEVNTCFLNSYMVYL